MGMVAGLVSAGVGIYSAVNAANNSGGNTAPTASNVTPAANPWAAPYMTEAAGSTVSTIPGLSAYNQWPQLLPQATATSQNLYNNPGIPRAQAGAQDASNMGVAAAGNMYGAGGNLMGAGQSLLPYASRIMDTGFDPQSALYQRTLQQVQDQARSGQAARGISMSPYGAGLENQNTRNFNIDWQNQQLQRQATAAGAAGGLTQAGAGVTNLGSQMQGAAAPLYAQAAMYPYATNQTIGQNQMAALQGQGQFAAQGAAIPQQQIDDWLRYMAAATGTAQAATGAVNSNLTGDQLNFNQNQTMLGNQQQAGTNLGSSLALLGNKLPQTGWGGGSTSATGWAGGTSGNWAQPYYQSNYGTPGQLFPGYTGGGG